MINEQANPKNNRNLIPADTDPKIGSPRSSFAGSDGAAGSIILRRMGFTKLDEGILQSSILMEDDYTFKIFMILLAACKEDGISRVSPVFLASITSRKIPEVMESLKKLSEPDKYSRSLNNEGRRIRRVDGGYEIINYHKYRNFSYSQNPDAIRKRNKRNQSLNNMKTDSVRTNSGHSASASDLYLNTSFKDPKDKEKKDPVKKILFVPPSLEEFREYCKLNGFESIASRAFNGYSVADWHDSEGKKIKNWKQKCQHVWFNDNNRDKPHEPKSPTYRELG